MLRQKNKIIALSLGFFSFRHRSVPGTSKTGAMRMLVRTTLAMQAAAFFTITPLMAQPTTMPENAEAVSMRLSGEKMHATADDLLKALESADVGLRTLRAGIIYEKVFSEGDRQLRSGTLYFLDSRAEGKAGTRKFAAEFDVLLIGTRREEEKKVYIFDGKLLVEKTPGEKKMVKTEISRDGQGFDPLKIGEGPMPIPIGQKREDILSRFDVALLPAEADLEGVDDTETDQLREHVKGAYQLKLIPRGDYALESKFAEIRLWYRHGADGKLLPRMARGFGPLIDDARDIETVRLVNVRLNQEIPPEMFDTSTPGGWDVVIR